MLEIKGSVQTVSLSEMGLKIIRNESFETEILYTFISTFEQRVMVKF